MRRARLTLGYDGADFVGSQIQGSGRTVQRELELAIQRLAPGSGRTSFAGRTDRGVHAVGQVVSLDGSWSDSAERLRDALNVVLPPATRGQIAWVYQFALGALLHHISDSRIERLSRGENTQSDPAAAPLLASFIVGGIRAAIADVPSNTRSSSNPLSTTRTRKQ